MKNGVRTKVAKLVRGRSKQANQSHAEQAVFENIQQQIRDRAYEFFVARGYEHGHQEEDWSRAEREVLAKHKLS